MQISNILRGSIVPKYYGDSCTYETAAELGSGGEGSVYSLIGRPNSVLKIYHPNMLKSSDLERKVSFMVSVRSSIDAHVLPSLAWPSDVVRDSHGKFAGFVMPKVSGAPINKCYGSFDFTLSYFQRIRIARNLCSLVVGIHSINQTIGDFNPNNIFVDRKTGLVSLVDTDSFHLKNMRGIVFRCGVGLGEYLAPEIQGINLSTTTSQTYTQDTDRFALAIHIFRLLMNGTHPYTTAKASIGAGTNTVSSVSLPQKETAIKNGESPHFSRKRAGTIIPPYCPQLDILPENIRSLFQRAFDFGHSDPNKRPSAAEWFLELQRVEKDVVTCTADKKHTYLQQARKCPWCALQTTASKKAKARAKSNPKPAGTPNAPTNQGILLPANTQTTSPAPVNTPTYFNTPFGKPPLSHDGKKLWIYTGITYTILAFVHVLFIVPTIDPDLLTDRYTGLKYIIWLGIPAGYVALWFINWHFIEKWCTRSPAKWEYIAAIVAAIATCAFSPLLIAAALAATVFVLLILFVFGLATSA